MMSRVLKVSKSAQRVVIFSLLNNCPSDEGQMVKKALVSWPLFAYQGGL